MSDHIEIPQVILDMINRELDKKRFEPKLCIKLVHHLCFEKNAKCLQSLESAWSSYFEDEEPFSIYQDKVHKIVHEALNGTKNKTFYFDMNQIWHDFTFDQANIYKDKHQYFETLISNNKKYLESNIFELNVLRFLSKLKAKDLVSMLKCIETIVAYYDDNDEDDENNDDDDDVDDDDMEGSGNYFQMVIMSALFSLEDYLNIKRWLNGEISGERCCMEIYKSLASKIDGLDNLVGLAEKSACGDSGQSDFSNWCKIKLFNLPRDKTLKNAYELLEIHHSASNENVYKRYKKLSSENHKNGQIEDFYKVECAYVIIKASKGKN